MEVGELLKEAHAIAALLKAAGHPHLHTRIEEALFDEMPDEARIPMLHYDFSILMNEPRLSDELRIRLARFVKHTA